MKPPFGQNFLADPSVLEFEAKEADVAKKSVLEIGAGDGRLTSKLLYFGAGHITAVEIDPVYAKKLRIRFQHQKRVKIIEGDFLEFDESAHYNVIAGNIPYNITSPIIFKIARMDFDNAILCVQKEFAERMIARPGTREYGRLSVSSQIVFDVEILKLVPKESFDPKPKVDSCVISIRKNGKPPTEWEAKVIEAIFPHKKKCLKNAIVDGRMALFGKNDKALAAKACQNLKYADRKVFTLEPFEALQVAEELGKWISRQ